MQWGGVKLEGVEWGNAWALHSPETPHTNWIVGDHPAIPADSLRFVRHGGPLEDGEQVEKLAVKWFAHNPEDPQTWGAVKPISCGRTFSLLAGIGAFELTFCRGEERLTLLLESPGDFAVWGAGISHSWRVLKPSLVMTLRWELVGEDDG